MSIVLTQRPDTLKTPESVSRAALLAIDRVSRNADLVMYATLWVSSFAALVIGYLNFSFDVAGVATLVILGAGSLAFFGARGSRLSCFTLTVANVAMVALHIQAAHGVTEYHFGVFVLLGLLLIYRDWRPLVLACVLFAVHHLLFDRLQSLQFGFFCMEHPGLPRVLLHAVYVVVQTAIEVVLAMQLRASTVEAAELSDIVGSIDMGDRVNLDVDGFAATSSSAIALKAAVAKVRDAMHLVTDTALHVENVAYELADGNADLSRRTESQASSLQETTASMEDFSRSVESHAKDAHMAAQASSSAANVAQSGGQVVTEVVDTMQGIANSSRKMVDIIEVIESIAFQTNILALNAAVEAARAGSNGKGFAVVAGEVRALATRASGAAKEIKALISSSTAEITRGSALVGKAGSAMSELVASVNRVAATVEAISSTNQEHADGFRQLRHALTLMDDMTQRNAAQVEESAAASSSLHAETQRLRSIASIFHFRAQAANDSSNLLRDQ